MDAIPFAPRRRFFFRDFFIPCPLFPCPYRKRRQIARRNPLRRSQPVMPLHYGLSPVGDFLRPWRIFHPSAHVAGLRIFVIPPGNHFAGTGVMVIFIFCGAQGAF